MAFEPFFSKVRIRWQDAPANEYPFNVPAVKSLDKLVFDKPVTYLVGENGSGKSTLIEALAVAAGFNAEGGTKNFNFSTNKAHSDLHDCITLARSARREKDGFFLRAESIFNVSTEIERLDKIVPLMNSYGGVSLHKRSHGESFLALVTNRFGKDGLFFLDEPESALSPARQLALLMEISRLIKQGGQFIISTHSPILMSYPGSRLYWLDETGATEKDWKQTEHYELTKMFLETPAAFLKRLI